jgi:hypothetical protein
MSETTPDFFWFINPVALLGQSQDELRSVERRMVVRAR